MCLPALFLLCFIITLCGIISLLLPYTTLGNEAFPFVTHIKSPLRKICITVKTPLMTWVKQVFGKFTPHRGKRVVKCALNPGIGRVKSPLSPALPLYPGGRGAGVSIN